MVTWYIISTLALYASLLLLVQMARAACAVLMRLYLGGAL